MSYRHRASPLHAAGAATGAAWCVVLAAAALALAHPLAVAAVVAIALTAGALARVGREVGRAVLWVAPLALAWALVNPFVAREGVTVFARLGELPVLGEVDLTVEAAAYGGISGLRIVAVVACFALFTAAVDPDQLLRLFRRVSFRSALAATLATRMVPVLARDAARMAEAQRCRPGAPHSRLVVLRAVATGALDRALDVAATLELRGYSTGVATPRLSRARTGPFALRRQDAAFGLSALAAAALVAWALASGTGSFDAYPVLGAGEAVEAALLAVALAGIALLPFTQRRGIEP